jgi:hypothetical protein
MHDVNTSADHVFLLTIANARSVVRRPRLASPMPMSPASPNRIAEPHRRTASPNRFAAVADSNPSYPPQLLSLFLQ